MRRPPIEDPQAATSAAPRSRDTSARFAIDRDRERTRGWIAIALFAPLSVSVLLAVLALVFGRLTVADLKELFASLSLNTLIRAAMGFYFGRLTK
jgi:hypothetical protein